MPAKQPLPRLTAPIHCRVRRGRLGTGTRCLVVLPLLVAALCACRQADSPNPTTIPPAATTTPAPTATSLPAPTIAPPRDDTPTGVIARVVASIEALNAEPDLGWTSETTATTQIRVEYVGRGLVADTVETTTVGESGVRRVAGNQVEARLGRQRTTAVTTGAGSPLVAFTIAGEARQVNSDRFIRAAFDQAPADATGLTPAGATTLPDGWVPLTSSLTAQYWSGLQLIGLDRVTERLDAAPDALLLERDAAKIADIMERALVSAVTRPVALANGQPGERITVALDRAALVVFFPQLPYSEPAVRAVYESLQGPVVTFHFTLTAAGRLQAVERVVALEARHVSADYDPSVQNEAFADATLNDRLVLFIETGSGDRVPAVPAADLADLPAYANPGAPANPAFPTLATFDAAVGALAAPDVSPADVDRFWDDVLSLGQMPLIFGDSVVFLYRGPALSVRWAGDWLGWEPGPGSRLGATDIWYAVAQFPPDGRIEYKLVIDGAAVWALDRLNPLTQPGGFGPNSVLRMPDYEIPAFLAPQEGVTQGELTDDLTLASAALGRDVHYRVYTPAGYADMADLPVVYVTDGQDFLAFAAMDVALDNLIASGVVRPLLAVFIDPRDTATGQNLRDTLFLDNPAYATFLATELIPAIDAAYLTEATASARAVIGASYGGYFTARFAAEHAEVCGNAGILSPALWVNTSVYEPYRSPISSLRIYLETGRLSDNLEEARRLRDLLEEGGYDYLYREAPEGHSYGNWAGVLDDMLGFFFPSAD